MDEEDQWPSGRESDDDWGDDFDGGLRGWIPPDDRLWRHPSEAAGEPSAGQPSASQPSASRHPAAPHPPGSPDRTGPWLVGGATACVIVALVAATLMVATTNRSDGEPASSPKRASLTDVPTTEPGMGPVAPVPAVAEIVAKIRPSTVALLIESTTGTSVATGLVVAAGGIIVTTSQAVTGARSITVVEQGGDQVHATRIGSDPESGISVLNIGDDLPPATSDFTGPSRGAMDMAVAVGPGPRTGRAPSPTVYAGKVVSAGVALGLDPVSTTFAAFGVEAPLSSADVGCPLLNGAGQVVGVLERAGGKGLASASTFLPAELVWGVAEQLVTAGNVDPGWMGITTADAAAPSAPVGALVDTVAAGSPAAAGGIQRGDIVTAVDGYRVRSGAELGTLLYPEPAGNEVTVTLDREGTVLTRNVVLADEEPDAPEPPSSP